MITFGFWADSKRISSLIIWTFKATNTASSNDLWLLACYKFSSIIMLLRKPCLYELWLCRGFLWLTLSTPSLIFTGYFIHCIDQPWWDYLSFNTQPKMLYRTSICITFLYVFSCFNRAIIMDTLESGIFFFMVCWKTLFKDTRIKVISFWIHNVFQSNLSILSFYIVKTWSVSISWTLHIWTSRIYVSIWYVRKGITISSINTLSS